MTSFPDLTSLNTSFQDASPGDILQEAARLAEGRLMISTNFRPYEAVLLHMAVQVMPDIPVLWVDHGYNTPGTYRCAEATIEKLNLNVHLSIPKRTSAHRDTMLGGIPTLDQPELHDLFTEEVKLEPFRRGMAELNPAVWLTALRRVQNPNRETMQVFGRTPDGVLKVSPVLAWTDEQMQEYIDAHELPNEFNYYDPTKVLESRECGLHLDSARL
jgi:phosphoadenosine phosphosulfate reductase